MQEITSQDNGKLRAFMALCREKKERDRSGLCVLDGVKICRDAAATGYRLRQLWITGDAAERYARETEELSAAADEIFVIRSSAAKKLSELNSPQGVFAAVERPAPVSVKELASHSRILGLCGLQNPENVGGCVRTATALGFGALLLSSDCADIWSPRAVRAAAGTQFSCSISVTSDFAASVGELRDEGVLTCASALHRDSIPVTEVEKGGRLFLAVGSEGQGLPDDVTEACDKTVRIPMSASAESLNAAAAAAVMMWELREAGALN